MKILVIGATGTLGSAVTAALEKNGHEIVRASRRGPLRIDMEDHASIDALFETVHDLDAVVCCAASGALTRLDSDDDITAGLQGKLLGQIHLLRRAMRHLRDGGSVTLTGGRFDRLIPGASFTATVNTGLEAFVEAAAIEMPRGLRVNIVSPGWIAETLVSMGPEVRKSLDLEDTQGTPAADVARAYVEAVEGNAQGQTFHS
ncbi:short chain dehydrogenase [Actinomadura terrae]|uniref:short chain dehydrogenase n=1 Tax=Actinomadura terrae TaxID=604353 RepID=UPI001FA73FFD|nr:short chain dehydrogenase [Actinomadura terrae]